MKITSKYVANKNDVAVWNQLINIPIQIPYVSQKIDEYLKEFR